MNIPASALPYIARQRARASGNNLFLRLMERLEFKFHFLHGIFGAFRVFFFTSAMKKGFAAMTEKEYNAMKPSLPQNASTVLDIGCGIAGIDIYLSGHYKSPYIYLLDKTASDHTITPGYADTHGFYNSLEAATELLVANGVQENTIHRLTPERVNELPEKIDLILSLFSCGFHYPIATYETVLKKCLANGGVVILDVRKGTEKEARQLLGEYSVIEEDNKRYRARFPRSV